MSLMYQYVLEPCDSPTTIYALYNEATLYNKFTLNTINDYSTAVRAFVAQNDLHCKTIFFLLPYKHHGHVNCSHMYIST